jgi:hypothetical protein
MHGKGRAVNLSVFMVPRSQSQIWRDTGLYHKSLRQQYEYPATHSWAPAPHVQP